MRTALRVLALIAVVVLAWPGKSPAQPVQPVQPVPVQPVPGQPLPPPPPPSQPPGFTPGELVNAGHRFFGNVSEGLAKGLAEGYRDVLYRVVGEVPFGPHLEVEHRVRCQRVEHVVEELDPRPRVGPARPLNGHFDGDVGLLGLADDPCLSQFDEVTRFPPPSITVTERR